MTLLSCGPWSRQVTEVESTMLVARAWEKGIGNYHLLGVHFQWQTQETDAGDCCITRRYLRLWTAYLGTVKRKKR